MSQKCHEQTSKAGRDFPLSRAWSQAIHAHSDRPVGSVRANRHDNSTLCTSLFDRAPWKLKAHCSYVFDPAIVPKLIKRWGFALG